ncbi:hypothetical protein LTR85_008528 [Meristemomyces frigidus]|nr:hypothetical protein LTR85_008528 [Meristemomyces frigidus]
MLGGVATAFPNPALGTEELSTRGQPDPDKWGEQLFRQGGDYCIEFCDNWPDNWRCHKPWPPSCFECRNVGLVHPCK